MKLIAYSLVYMSLWVTGILLNTWLFGISEPTWLMSYGLVVGTVADFASRLIAYRTIMVQKKL